MGIEITLKKAILKISNFFNGRNIPFVIVGALVPTVLIDMRRGQPAYGSRVTRDVDCVIAISSWDEYQNIKEDMVEDGFHVKKGSPEHRLFLGDTPVDVIPFGLKMIEDDILIWPGTDFRMNVRGFEKLFLLKEYVPIDDNLTIPFTPLPLAAFLKIQSYYDRQDTKDLEDLFYILINYEAIEFSEKRFSVAGKNDLNYDTAGAFLLGRDLRDQISADYQKDLEPFFEMFSEPESSLVLDVAKLSRQTVDEIISMVTAFKRGFKNQIIR